MSTLNHLDKLLFNQIENLSNPDLTSKTLEIEVKKAKTVASLASQIVKSANLQLTAKQLLSGAGQISSQTLPDVFKLEHKE